MLTILICNDKNDEWIKRKTQFDETQQDDAQNAIEMRSVIRQWSFGIIAFKLKHVTVVYHLSVWLLDWLQVGRCIDFYAHTNLSL